jgi:hypothetical protein
MKAEEAGPGSFTPWVRPLSAAATAIGEHYHAISRYG